MSFFKKKLGALIPNESARGALQNVLTVEWSGHKTVLVEVPNAVQNDDVEMSGMGESSRYGGYGRLDDENDEREYLNQNKPSKPNYDRERERQISNTNTSFKSLPPLPNPHPSRSTPPPQSKSRNPFISAEEEVDELDLNPNPTTQYQYQYPTYEPQQPRFQLDDKSHRNGNGNGNWATFGGSAVKVGKWETGSVGVASPTSSTGTRSSGISGGGEDPFR